MIRSEQFESDLPRRTFSWAPEGAAFVFYIAFGEAMVTIANFAWARDMVSIKARRGDLG